MHRAQAAEPLIAEQATAGAPLISVVIPTYNCAEYVGKAIDSILCQANDDVEVIVVDDGSTDATASILRDYVGDQRVYILHQQNAGLGPARNAGLGVCRGTFVQFLDADDLLDPSFLHTIKDLLDSYGEGAGPDLICFGAVSFFEADVERHPTVDYSRGVEGVFSGQGAALRALHDAHSLLPNSVLYISRVSLWKQTNLAFRPIYHEDEDVLIPLFSQANTVIVANRPLYLRRLRRGSIMTSGFGERSARGYEAIMRRYLELLRANDPVLVAARDIIRSRLFVLLTTYAKETAALRGVTNRRLVARVLWALKSVEATLRVVRSLRRTVSLW